MAFMNKFKGKYGFDHMKPKTPKPIPKALDPNLPKVGNYTLKSFKPPPPLPKHLNQAPTEESLIDQISSGMNKLPLPDSDMPERPINFDPVKPSMLSPITPPPSVIDKDLQALATQNTTPENANNILANLDPELQSQIKKNILGMASGSMFDANRALSDQAFAAQAKNLRAQGGAFNAPNIGQGAARRGQQAIEQGVMEQLSAKNLKENVAKNQLMQQGTQFGTDLAQQNAANELKAAGIASGEKLKALDILSSEKQQAAGIASSEKQLAAQIESNEKMAKDANWLQQQGVDLETAKLKGYTDANGNHVKGNIEINQEIFGLEQDKFKNEQAWDNFNIAVAAGDYDGANAIAKANGIATIDWSKEQDKEKLKNVSESINDLENMLNTVDPNSSPEFFNMLVKQYGKAYGEKQKLLGTPFDQQDLDDMINKLNSGESNIEEVTAFDNYLNDTVVDWWENGLGKNMGNMLDGDAAEWYKTIADPNSNEKEVGKAAENLSNVIWAAYANESGFALTKKQKESLSKAGLAPEDWGKDAEKETTEEVDAYFSGLKPFGELKGAESKDHKLHDVYNKINNKAEVWEWNAAYDTKGDNGYKFKNPPAKGSFIKFEGDLYKVISDTKLHKPIGKDQEEFTIQNVNTGQTSVINARYNLRAKKKAT